MTRKNWETFKKDENGNELMVVVSGFDELHPPTQAEKEAMENRAKDR